MDTILVTHSLTHMQCNIYDVVCRLTLNDPCQSLDGYTCTLKFTHCINTNYRAHPECITFAHVLSHDVNGFLRHDGIKRHQLVMPELLHDLGLLKECLGGHGARLQRLNRHLGGTVPGA